jgi:hypothetical protein
MATGSTDFLLQYDERNSQYKAQVSKSGWQQPLSKAYKAPGVAEHEMFVQPVEDHLFHPNTDPEIQQMAQGALVHSRHSKQFSPRTGINGNSSFKVSDKPLYAKFRSKYQKPMAEFLVPELAHKLGLGDNYQARAGHINLKYNSGGTVHEPHEENLPQASGNPNEVRSLTLSKWVPIKHSHQLISEGLHDPLKGVLAFKETPENLHKLFLFDMLIQNGDRHQYNYGVDDNGRIQMIDHGMALLNYKPNSMMPNYMSDAGFGWGSELHPEARRWLTNLDPKEIAEFILSHGHSDLTPEDSSDLRKMSNNTKRRLKELQRRVSTTDPVRLRTFHALNW